MQEIGGIATKKRRSENILTDSIHNVNSVNLTKQTEDLDIKSSNFALRGDISTGASGTITPATSTKSTTVCISLGTTKLASNAPPDSTMSAMPKRLENVAVKIDPTQKASHMLITSLKEQRKQHERNKAKTVDTVFSSVLRSHSRRCTEKQQKTVKKRVTKRVTKIEAHNTIVNKTPCGFGQLRLDTIDGYDVPNKIFRIENGKDESYLVELERLSEKSPMDRNEYIQVFTALLQLEQAAEMMYIKRFNRTVQLSFYNDKMFQIKVEVSDDYFFHFYASSYVFQYRLLLKFFELASFRW